MAKLPAITGKQLIRLLTCDGWEERGQRTHGIALRKFCSDGRTRITVVPNKKVPLPEGTIHDILGRDQTNIGHSGLVELIQKYGLR
ncbi:MAG: hypothetical protein HY675_09185 [Chloroflexi bacterium]|nr:hypothetical protein [Chloroflexota bacterium]